MSQATAVTSDSGAQRSRLFTIIRNTLSILGSDVANRASSFALYALVARFLGEHAFGQMSLAQSTFYFLGYSLAGLGVRWFMARELAKKPEKTDDYLVNGTAMVLITTTLALIIFYVVGILSGYPADTRAAIMLMGLTIYPYTIMMVLEGTFIGREKMHFIFLVNAPVNVANIIITYLVLQNGGDLFAVITIQVVAYTLIAVVEWVLMLRFVTRPEFRIRLSEMTGIVRAASSFYGIDAVVAIGTTMQLYLISLVADETRVGLYSSSTQLTGPFVLILSSFTASMLPVLTKQVEPTFRRVKISASRLAELLFFISIPAVVGIFFVASDLLVLIYGREGFAEAGIYLQIGSTGLVLFSLIQVLGMILYATSNEQQNLRIVTINSFLYLIINLIAIPPYGAMGAAFAAVLNNVISAILHGRAVARTVKIHLNWPALIWRSLVASAVMAAALIVIPHDLNVLIRIVAGGLVYAVALIAVLLVTVGGPGKIRERYFSRPDDVINAQAAMLVPLAEGD